ncbi:MAG: hypothetical protein GKS00_19160 [Alphaproteobacteria bacterium]|nr:hypothetical protein [Alphaproteobacteria bacterium]
MWRDAERLGRLSVAAVDRVRPLPLGEDGSHVFPEPALCIGTFRADERAY